MLCFKFSAQMNVVAHKRQWFELEHNRKKKSTISTVFQFQWFPQLQTDNNPFCPGIQCNCHVAHTNVHFLQYISVSTIKMKFWTDQRFEWWKSHWVEPDWNKRIQIRKSKPWSPNICRFSTDLWLEWRKLRISPDSSDRGRTRVPDEDWLWFAFFWRKLWSMLQGVADREMWNWPLPSAQTKTIPFSSMMP